MYLYVVVCIGMNFQLRAGCPVMPHHAAGYQRAVSVAQPIVEEIQDTYTGDLRESPVSPARQRPSVQACYRCFCMLSSSLFISACRSSVFLPESHASPSLAQ